MAPPKYLAIVASLKERCQGLTVGSRLPSERALAEEFGVSVMTVRHALGRLADEGWIRRSAGSGTFVSRPTVLMGPRLSSFSEDMARRGLTAGSQVLRLESVTPDLEVVARLALRPQEPAVLLERLRSADGEPMCHEISLFPGRLQAALYSADLTGSAHAALAAAGVMARSAERSVRAVVAPERECELLKLPSGSPALEIVDLFTDTMGRPMQYARSRYRFDRYEVRTVIDGRR